MDLQKKLILINPESLTKILECFSDSEEFEAFMFQLFNTFDEIGNSLKAASNSTEENITRCEMVKQIFIVSLFYRRNIEIFRELINCLDYTYLSEEEKDKILKDEAG